MASNTSSRLPIFLVTVAALGAIVAVWLWLRPKPVDLSAIVDANQRGLGFMERFQYDEAIKAFNHVVHKAPGWVPGRINLGIALLNTTTPENLDRAEKLFQEVLREQPDHLHAHFSWGIIQLHKGQQEEAKKHFEAVTKIDPGDAHSWFWLASTEQPGSKEARNAFEKALAGDPTLGGAVYALGLALRDDDPDRHKQLLELHEKLKAAGVDTVTKMAYGKMGKYAEVIGRVEPDRTAAAAPPGFKFSPMTDFKVILADKGQWRTAEQFSPLEAKLRQRMGMPIIILDFDQDGLPDVYLCGAVMVDGKARDVLLRNEGGGVFRDVSAAAGLDLTFASLGAYAADYDNDGYPDLFLTGAGQQMLLRNRAAKDKAGFADVTKEAGLVNEKGVCLGATWVDLDQDGDLDLVICRYAQDQEQALALLEGRDAGGPAQEPALYLNVGEAKAAPVGQVQPLTTKLQPWAGKLAPPGHYLSVAFGDFNGDRAPDLVLLAKDQRPLVVINDKLLRFRSEAIPESVVAGKNFHGVLTLDSRQVGKADLVLLGESGSFLLLNETPKVGAVLGWAVPATGKYPACPQMLAADLDLDGRLDLGGYLPSEIVLFAGAQSRATLPSKDVAGMQVADVNGDQLPDLLLWKSTGLECLRNDGNGNHALKLELTGRRSSKEKLRCNADGLGTRVTVYAKGQFTTVEKATTYSGLGQSSQPMLLGLGKQTTAEVVSLRWPDGTWQAELSMPAGQTAKIAQLDRTPDSCPLLFAWNGHRYEFIADFLGAGTVGEMNPDGTVRPARPEESVLIRGHQLQPKNGWLTLKLTEPMDEVTYLDRLTLNVVDHPADVLVAPDERFSDPAPTQDLLAFRARVAPQKVLNHRGLDVTAALKDWDRVTVDGFARRSWLGYAEEHWIDMDFGDDLQKLLASPPDATKGGQPRDRVFLCLVGWTDYPYPEAMFAATQAGVPLLPPILEKPGKEGVPWQTVIPDIGFPAGRTRLMMVELTGKIGPDDRRLRIRTNMQVFWDQVFLAKVADAMPAASTADPCERANDVFRLVTLPVGKADLQVVGCQLEHSPDGRQPTVFDYHAASPAPVTRLVGKLTKLGDVTELLQQRDDRFAIFGPGDEVTVHFDASRLPPVAPGWTRSYVLRTWGYCKGVSPFTVTGGQVEPLPFAAMKQFPPGPTERFPQPKYVEQWNTRGPRR